MEPWYVYLVRCRDNTLYCGISKDVRKRVHEHNWTSKGAKYTRGRRCVTLVFEEKHGTKSEALKREAAIKKMRKAKKQELVKNCEEPTSEPIRRQ